jgi:protein translocase SecG subunit
MSFLAGILTVLLVVNCVVLIFLVLVQLPKKDAGAGVAFGGGAADALFGAGSGNALTKITKWATGIFFGLALLLGFMEVRLHRSNAAEFEKAVGQKQTQMPIAPPPATSLPAATPATNQLLLPPASPAVTAPATTATNAPAAPPQPK